MVIPAPWAHGGDGPAVARALGLDPAAVLDLSLSLNPCAPDVAALAARHVDSLRRYPDASDATRLLARMTHHGVVIRDCTSFGLPHHVRIAVPDERGLEQLATALSR